MAITNKIMRGIFEDNQFWENKFKRHFPHKFNNKFHEMPKQKDQANRFWCLEFRKIYLNEYRWLIPTERKILSFVKEGDVQSLAKLDLTYDIFSIHDVNNNDLLKWALVSGDQHILDHLYHIAQNYFKGKIKDYNGKNVLFFAISCMQPLSYVKDLALSSKFFLADTYEPHSFKVIHHAAASGRLDVVEYIINTDPDLINQADDEGRTPMIYAATAGHIEIVKFLIQKNANLFNMTSYIVPLGRGMTVLHMAIVHGRLGVVQYLTAYNSSLMTMCDGNGQTPLMLAVIYNQLDIFMYLLDHEVDVNAKINREIYNNGGKTALYFAVEKGQAIMVDHLLKKGADVFITYEWLQIFLTHLAAGHGHLDVLNVLIKCKSELAWVPNDRGETPLMFAAKSGHIDIVKYLIKNGAEVHQANNVCETALIYAVKANNEKIVRYLISEGADVNVATYNPNHDDHKVSALHWAFNTSNIIFQLLLDLGANPRIEDSYGNQLIHNAAYHDDLKIVKVLVNYDKTLIHEKNQFGVVPFLIACDEGYLDFATYLFENGADIYSGIDDPADQARHGITALHCAIDHGYRDIVCFLLSKGVTLEIIPNFDNYFYQKIVIMIDMASLFYFQKLNLFDRDSEFSKLLNKCPFSDDRKKLINNFIKELLQDHQREIDHAESLYGKLSLFYQEKPVMDAATYLFCCAMKYYDANIKFCPTIINVEQLMNVQQKRDAFIKISEKMVRLYKSSLSILELFDPGKYKNKLNMIIGKDALELDGWQKKIKIYYDIRRSLRRSKKYSSLCDILTTPYNENRIEALQIKCGDCESKSRKLIIELKNSPHPRDLLREITEKEDDVEILKINSINSNK